MGCGASKGTQPAAPPEISPSPAVAASEFSPDNKPKPIAGSDDLAKAKQESEKAKESARRVDQIVKTGVADFEDDTETTQDKPVETEPVLPPPPVTPPAAAKKPLFQTADTTSNFDDVPAESAEDSYFPKQVSLAVGLSSERQQQQSVPQQTSLQPFDLTPTPSAPELTPEPAPAAPPALPAPMFLPSSSSRQLQPLPQQQQLQLMDIQQQMPSQQRELQQQRSVHLPPLQGQPQPLTESGPGPGSSTTPPAAASDDPWSSLQSTYRIQESQAAVKSESARSRGTGSSRDAGREVLVLGDDDDDFGGGGAGLNSTSTSAMNRTSGIGGRPPISLPPPKFGSGPKQGGWGSGAMAQAGELMIGEDDWLVNDRPPGGSAGLASGLPPPPAQRQQSQRQPAAVMAYNSRAKLMEEEDRHRPVALKGPAPPAKGKAPAEDVLCEDVEDVDTLLEDEMERQGLSNKNLASKLAAYDAQFRDDDD